MTDEVKVKRTEEQIIRDMEVAFDNVNVYMGTIKDYKTEAKDAGYDGAILAKVAKARADDKVSELKEKTEALLGYLED